jgi:hypothetical protein
MTTDKKTKTSKQQSKKPADDLTKKGKKGETQLSEGELKRATGGMQWGMGRGTSSKV